MEKVCIIGAALVVGFITASLARFIGVMPSTAVIVGLLLSIYGGWLGEQLFLKIHH
ncbi:MAG TPA: hypothetical protein VFB27_09485 [Opitutaceae bacterium]|nr:hypothetical protein [Opitutaceae bacterium]